jgi:hypothetical protein
MHVTVVSSLDVFCRQQACAALAIALEGIGPRVWLENTGPWPAIKQSVPGPSVVKDPATDGQADFGDRGTVLAMTGEDVDATEIAGLLAACQVTDAEIASGAVWLDPFHLNQPSEHP